MLGDPTGQFSSRVVGCDFGGIVFDELDAGSPVDVEPPLVLPLLLSERAEDALLIVGVELPV